MCLPSGLQSWGCWQHPGPRASLPPVAQKLAKKQTLLRVLRLRGLSCPQVQQEVWDPAKGTFLGTIHPTLPPALPSLPSGR